MDEEIVYLVSRCARVIVVVYERDVGKLLGEVANIEITVDLIRCLRPRTWLNDEVSVSFLM